MQRRTQGIVALGASVVLGVLAGVLVTVIGPGREVRDRNPTPVQSSAAAPPSPSTADDPAALRGVPSGTTSATSSASPTTRPSPTPALSETDDNRGRGRGRGGDDNRGSGGDDDGANEGGDDG